jgi:nucleotide-binding universal stress UspA family protein
MAISRILMPVDYSDASREAVQFACYLAKHLGAALDIVHVWDRPAYVADTVVVAQGGGKPKSLAEMIRENAEAEMKEFLASCQVSADVRVTSHLESGEPASTILRVAEKTGVDLVIVGTHGRTGVRHLLLGSIAEKLVRLSPVPVLTVPPPEPGTP